MNSASCLTLQAADLVGKKWTVSLIQQVSLYGDEGFNSLLRRMKDISPKLLSQRLNELEQLELLEKTVINDKVERTSYRLTTKGMELNDILKSLKTWNLKYSGGSSECLEGECVNCGFYQ